MRKKSVKRIVSFAVAICLLFGMIPFIQVVETSATGANITASINGCQPQTGVNLMEVLQKSVQDGAYINSINVERGVLTAEDIATIKSNLIALKNLSVGGEVTMDDMSLTSLIGATAPSPNASLETVSITNAKMIPPSTFAFCTALREVTLPNVAVISDNAFLGCTAFHSLTLGEVPPTVAANAFDGCPDDKIVFVPESTMAAYTGYTGYTGETPPLPNSENPDAENSANGASSDVQAPKVDVPSEPAVPVVSKPAVPSVEGENTSNPASNPANSGGSVTVKSARIMKENTNENGDNADKGDGLSPKKWNGFTVMPRTATPPATTPPAGGNTGTPKANVIAAVAIAITAPTTGAVPETTATITQSTLCKVDTVAWSPAIAVSGKFAAGTEYTATFTISPTAANADTFDTGLTAMVNNNNATATVGNPASTATVTYKFPATVAAPVNAVIDKVDLQLAAPVTGQALSLAATIDARYTVANTVWYNGTTQVASGTQFLPNVEYKAVMTLNAVAGNAFPATPNTIPVYLNSAFLENKAANSTTQMTVEKTFPVTHQSVTGLSFVFQDATTGTPISGAKVTCTAPNASSLTAGTDAAGFCGFAGLTAGTTYKISASASGFATYSADVLYDATKTQPQIVALNKQNGSTLVKVTPATVDVIKGKEQEFQADVTDGAVVGGNVTWSIRGNTSTGTTIQAINGVKAKLKVDSKENAKEIQVVATSTNGTTGEGKVNIKDIPPAVEIGSPVKPNVQTPVTDENIMYVVNGEQYEGTIRWSPNTGGGQFRVMQKYTANVTLNAKEGFQFKKDSTVELKDATKVYNVMVSREGEKNTLSFRADYPSTFDPTFTDQANFEFANLPNTRTYGDPAFSAYARGGTGSGKVTYKSSDPTVLKIIDANDVATVLPMKVGNAKIIAEKDGDPYAKVNPISMESQVIYVQPAKLTATVKDLTIHEGDTPKYDVTVKGFLNDDSEEYLKATGFKRPIASSKGKKIGNYEIIVSGGNPTNNYEFEYTNGKLRIVDVNADINDDSGSKLVSKDVPNEVSVEKLSGDMFESGTTLKVVDMTAGLTPEQKIIYNKDIMNLSKGKEVALVYDITLMKDGKEIQPNGDLNLNIKVPSSVRENYRELELVHIDDSNKSTIVPSVLSYDNLSCKTNSFSRYAIIGIRTSSSRNPQTGDSRTFTLGFTFLGIAALGALMFAPKRKAIKVKK